MKNYFNRLSDVIFMIDKDMKIIYVTPSVERILGYQSTELIGRNFVETGIIYSDDLNRVLDDVKKVLSGEIMSNGEYRFVTRDGDVREVGISCGAFMKGEEIIGFTGIARDVAESKSKERLFKEIFDSINEGVLLIDRNYNIILANMSILRSFELDEDKIKNLHCYELMHHFNTPCSDNGEECPLEKVFESGRVMKVIHKHLDRDNNEKFVEITTYPVRNLSGDIWAVIEVINDITERYILEEENKKKIKELERFYEMAIERELRMKELKDENRRLRKEISRLKR